MKNNQIKFIVILLFLLSITSCSNSKNLRINKPNKNVDSLSTISKTKSLSKFNNDDYPELSSFVNEWIGVKYKYNGHDKKGIDCSHFVCRLLIDVYSFKKDFYLPSYKLPLHFVKISKENVQIGDLLFFDINNKGISHVGVYLGDDNFIHASTKNGVIISNLKEVYYSKKFLYFATMPK